MGIQPLRLSVDDVAGRGPHSGPAHTTEVSRIAQPNNRETVTVRDNIASSILVPRFIRLRVTQ